MEESGENVLGRKSRKDLEAGKGRTEGFESVCYLILQGVLDAFQNRSAELDHSTPQPGQESRFAQFG